MASFSGVAFAVIPNGGFFPNIEPDSGGINRYKATVQFATKANRNSIYDRVSVGSTWKRSIGSSSYTGQLDTGVSASLIVPLYGGHSFTGSAVLVSMSNIKGYGRYNKPTFQAEVEFVIVADPTV